MIRDDQNQLLTRIGPGTPLGAAMRKFWMPFLQTKDLVADGPMQRVDLMGEQLLAFRGTDGKVGLIERFCAHRGAELFFGRNEHCGVRCSFHGWKYDRTGQCVDIPNVPEGPQIQGRIKVKAYPVEESGGLLWTCMTDDFDNPAPFHGAPWTLRGEQEGQWCMGQIECDGNYVQHLEGLADDNHVAFLHLDLSSGGGGDGLYEDSPAFTDAAPAWAMCEATDFGAMLGWSRKTKGSDLNFRLNIFILPCMVAVKSPDPADFETWQYCVPMDDERTMFYLVFSRPDKPMSEGEKALFTDPSLNFFPPMIPGTHKATITRHDDYGIDREAQRDQYYSGVKIFRLQDMCVQEYVKGGLLADRSGENLVSSDRGVIAMRKRLIDLAIKQRDTGALEEPEAVARHVFIPLDKNLPPEQSMAAFGWEEGVKPLDASAGAGQSLADA